MSCSSITWLDSTTSTNLEARKLSDVVQGFCVATLFQENGRGQAGNTWDSEKGKNILSSFIFHVNTPIEESFHISMKAALAIADFLETYTSDLQIKWPNDIIVNNKKIAGILVENEILGNNIDRTIVGIGININQLKFENLSKATSLAQITGKEYSIQSLIAELQNSLKSYFIENQLSEHELKAKFINKLYQKERALYKDHKSTFEASVFDIASDGKMTLQRDDNSKSAYYFKQIEMIF